MKCVLVWLAVMTTTFHTSLAQCEDGGRQYERGDIIVRGIQTTNLRAGRMESCLATEWHALCDDGWESRVAELVCQNFYPEGFDVLLCSNSCFGKSNRTMGLRFQCNETRCQASTNNVVACQQDAGIVCTNLNSTMTPDGPSTQPASTFTPANLNSTMTPDGTSTQPASTFTPANTMTPDGPSTQPASTFTPANLMTPDGPSTQPASTFTPTEHPNTEHLAMAACTGPSLAALGGGLGGLCAILAILQVGVVIGWVWSCLRSKGKQRVQQKVITYHSECEEIKFEDNDINPAYSLTSAAEVSSSPPIYEAIPEKTNYTNSKGVERGEEEEDYF